MISFMSILVEEGGGKRGQMFMGDLTNVTKGSYVEPDWE